MRLAALFQLLPTQPCKTRQSQRGSRPLAPVAVSEPPLKASGVWWHQHHRGAGVGVGVGRPGSQHVYPLTPGPGHPCLLQSLWQLFNPSELQVPQKRRAQSLPSPPKPTLGGVHCQMQPPPRPFSPSYQFKSSQIDFS